MYVEPVVFSLDVRESVCLILSSDIVVSGHEFGYFRGESVILADIFSFFSEAQSADVMLFCRVRMALSTSIWVARVEVIVRKVSHN